MFGVEVSDSGGTEETEENHAPPYGGRDIVAETFLDAVATNSLTFEFSRAFGTDAVTAVVTRRDGFTRRMCGAVHISV